MATFKISLDGELTRDGCGRYCDLISLGLQSLGVLTHPSSRFNASGQLFKISAKDNQTWIVHEAVIAKSPVLARMCQTPMAEAKTRIIKLPDDEPSIFGRVLEYLYCADYSPWTEAPLGNEGRTFKPRLFAVGGIVPDRDSELLASIYIMADKYQLEQLQELTISKIKLLLTLSDGAYYSMVHKVYDAIPSSDVCFRKYFMESVGPRLARLQAPELTKLLEKIEAGGPLARDYFEAQHKAFAKGKDGSSGAALGYQKW